MTEKYSLRELLDIRIIDSSDGYAKMTMKVTKAHTNFMGLTHGGAIFALADCAFGEAANQTDQIAVALQADIKFLKPSSEGDTLVAEATRTTEGKTFGVYNVTVSKEEKTVAIFSGLAYKQQKNESATSFTK
jgi:acyl-CoA thioesterase